MDFSEEQIQSLVSSPTESLGIELKRWIDPTVDDGIAKIAKACIAMRNNNGGFVAIGFDNDTRQPDPNRPSDVRGLYHFDRIQAILSKYASEVFEVTVKFAMRDGQEFPVICVPSGIRTPVAAKAGLTATNGTTRLIKEHQVYVRSLNSNGTASTTEAKWQDLDRLVTICMDNREADIGRFLRRHLITADVEKLRAVLSAKAVGATSDSELPDSALVIEPSVKPKIEASRFLDEGQARFQAVVAERELKLPEHGALEITFVIDGQFPSQSTSESFLNLISASNPRLSGWPFWLDGRGFHDKSAEPYVFEGYWEALILSIRPELTNKLDFWRIDPCGRFYHRRMLEDDSACLAEMPPNRRYPKPGTTLDFSLPIHRIADVMATGMHFAKALGCTPDKTSLQFRFRWTKLKGRELSSWVHPDRDVWSRQSYQDTVCSDVSMPLETASSALFQYVHEATKPLFQVFSGFELSPAVTEGLVKDTLKGR